MKNNIKMWRKHTMLLYGCLKYHVSYQKLSIFIILLDSPFRMHSQDLTPFQEAISVGRVVISCREFEYDCRR